MEDYRSLSGKTVKIARWMIIFPASFLIGTLILTWCVYIAAYLFRNTGRPLYYGNMTVVLLFTIIVAVLLYGESYKKKEEGLKAFLFSGTKSLEYGFALITLAIAAFMMIFTFHVKDNNLIIGLSVFSDFSPHMAMIRSFSHGLNFPTEYPFFADGTVRYHFMFQFLAGNLEFLGLRFDWAFNIPSILGYVSFVILLFVVAVVITGRKAVGILTCVLFFFRSSFAFFTYLKDVLVTPSNLKQLLIKILYTDEFIGKTQNENWGFWNQNVFLNQRHFAFALGIMVLIILAVYPLFREMLANLADCKKLAVKKDDYSFDASKHAVVPGKVEKFLFCKEAWIPRSFVQPVFIGLLLGLLGFWNGAVVFATLPVLFILAIMSSCRLEYLIIAVLAVGISYMETSFFIGDGSSVVKPLITTGFIAANKSIVGIATYLIELLGLLPFVIAAALGKPPKGTRWLCLSFIAPMVFVFTIQLTPDIGVNHKYVMIAVLLLDILAADFLLKLFRARFTKVLAVLLIIIMTLTGVVDILTVYNMNNPNNINGKRPFTLRLDDPLTKWVEDNTGPNEIFLTNTYFIHPLLISGRKIFLGYHYFSWSAGYNTIIRENIAKKIFNAQSKEELIRLVKENKISYILIDNDLRSSQVYKVNENLIGSTLETVYDEKASNIKIYKVK